MKMQVKVVSAIVVLALFAMTGAVHATQVVVNGGFETGDFSGWTLTADTAFTGVGDVPYSGRYGAFLGEVNGVGTLSQTLSTIAGQQYTVSFRLASDGFASNTFFANWNDNPIFFDKDIASLNYVLYSFTVTALGNDILTFGFRDDEGYLYLDDISVTNAPTGATVPLPATVLFLAPGLAGLAVIRRRVKS